MFKNLKRLKIIATSAENPTVIEKLKEILSLHPRIFVCFIDSVKQSVQELSPIVHKWVWELPFQQRSLTAEYPSKNILFKTKNPEEIDVSLTSIKYIVESLDNFEKNLISLSKMKKIYITSPGIDLTEHLLPFSNYPIKYHANKIRRRNELSVDTEGFIYKDDKHVGDIFMAKCPFFS